MALTGVPRIEEGAAGDAGPLGSRSPAQLATVSVQRCGAVGTHNAQILKAIIGGVAVRVIEDEGHAPTPPNLALAAHLADGSLQAFTKQTLLQRGSTVRGVLHEDFLDRPWPVRPSEGVTLGSVRIEVGRRDLPHLLGIAPNRCVVAPGRAHRATRPHDTNTSSISGWKESWGGGICTPVPRTKTWCPASWTTPQGPS
jgi:hypothetical protein